MKTIMLVLGALGLLALTPSTSHAQYRRGRSGVVMSPYGLLYDTRSPEWRMSGGNIFLYQQLMAQKQLMFQQRMMMAQQRQLLRGSQRGNGKAFANGNGLPANPLPSRRKLKPGTTAGGPAAGAINKAPSPAPSERKPADTAVPPSP
jgi:hypothetical protein